MLKPHSYLPVAPPENVTNCRNNWNPISLHHQLYQFIYRLLFASIGTHRGPSGPLFLEWEQQVAITFQAVASQENSSIFVHTHLIVARKCRMHGTTFSIKYGVAEFTPQLYGCIELG